LRWKARLSLETWRNRLASNMLSNGNLREVNTLISILKTKLDLSSGEHFRRWWFIPRLCCARWPHRQIPSLIDRLQAFCGLIYICTITSQPDATIELPLKRSLGLLAGFVSLLIRGWLLSIPRPSVFLLAAPVCIVLCGRVVIAREQGGIAGYWRTAEPGAFARSIVGERFGGRIPCQLWETELVRHLERMLWHCLGIK
jgi:hypothetical protein